MPGSLPAPEASQPDVDAEPDGPEGLLSRAAGEQLANAAATNSLLYRVRALRPQLVAGYLSRELRYTWTRSLRVWPASSRGRTR